MRYNIIFTFLLFSCSLQAQILTGINSKWTDEFTEWNLFTDVEDEEGNLSMRWVSRMDWTEWDYRLGESSGSIRQKWKDDPTQWEVRGEGEIITIRMKWNNDISEWTLSDGTNKFTMKTRHANNMNDWRLKNDSFGKFEIYTEWENDPRDWIIIDELDEEISFPMKMAMVFISVYHSFPKE